MSQTANLAAKPTVRYRDLGVPISVGRSAIVQPVDHPNHLEGHLVSNAKPVKTSAVISYDEKTGVFETRNTVYSPA